MLDPSLTYESVKRRQHFSCETDWLPSEAMVRCGSTARSNHKFFTERNEGGKDDVGKVMYLMSDMV